MKILSRGNLVGCLLLGGCLGLGVLINIPKFMASTNATKAGEGSRTLRAMATAHAAKPEVTAFSFTHGKGGDAGWKALGLPEDAKYHDFDAWTDAEGRLWMTAIGNLDEDEALDEWEWPGPVASPVQLREDNRNEWEGGLFYLQRPETFPPVGPNPVFSHEERMRMAAARAVHDSGLRLRWATEEFGDKHLRYRVDNGKWDVEGTTPGDERFHFLVKVTNGTEMIGVAGFANFDGDPCVDMWRIRFPDRTAEHVSDDSDDRGCDR